MPADDTLPTAADLAELRALAAAADSQDWNLDDPGPYDFDDEDVWDVGGPHDGWVARRESLATARFVATADPRTVTAMCDYIAALSNMLAEFVDDEPCDLDHHGGCQTHDCYEPEPGELCRNQRAKHLLLDEVDTDD